MPPALLLTVNGLSQYAGVYGGARDRESSGPRQLRFYALTYPFGFSTNFVAEPASNSA